MKTIRIIVLVIIALSFNINIAYAQTMHAIIFANTQNKDIGTSVEVDYQCMSLELTTIAKSIGYNLKKYYYHGDSKNFCRSNLDLVLNNLTCGPNDIVYFYYSGHGGRAQNEETAFPEMVLRPNEPTYINDLYPLYNVYTRIKSKSPRLTIVMGDLCNSVVEGLIKRPERNKGATVLSKNVCDAYKNLFLGVKGGLIATSSKPGQTSGCALKQNEHGQLIDAGGYFTCMYLAVLQNCVKTCDNISWDDVLNATIANTVNATSYNGRKPQTPIFFSELKKTTDAPTTTITSTPQPPIDSNDADTNLQDKIAYTLSKVGNKNISMTDRIRNIQSALNTVKPSTRIQVVGCDNKTIVNTTTAEKYLNYLSIATNIDQIVVLDIEKTGNGVPSSLRIHEIHYN